MTFEQILKQRLKKQGLNYEIAQRIYNRIFKFVRKVMSEQTHNYILVNKQPSIYVPWLGRWMARFKPNYKEYKQHIEKKENELFI